MRNVASPQGRWKAAAVLLAGAAAGAAACLASAPGRCRTKDDCPPTARCHETLKVCVAAPDDTTPPQIAVTVERAPDGGTPRGEPMSAYAGAYLRSGRARILVVANEPLQAGSVMARVWIAGPDAGPATAVAGGTDGCDGGAWCGTAELDLASPAMLEFRSAFQVYVTGRDLADNEGTGQSETGDSHARVTRWKWESGTGGGAILSPPAIDEDGTLIVGYAGVPGLRAHRPQDGTVRATESTAGPIWSSPVLGSASAGEAPVFVVIDVSGKPAARAFHWVPANDAFADGGAPCPQTGVTAASLNVSGAYARTGPDGGEDTFFFALNEELFSYRPRNGPIPCFAAPIGAAVGDGQGVSARSGTSPEAPMILFFGESAGRVRIFYYFMGILTSGVGFQLPGASRTRRIVVAKGTSAAGATQPGTYLFSVPDTGVADGGAWVLEAPFPTQDAIQLRDGRLVAGTADGGLFSAFEGADAGVLDSTGSTDPVTSAPAAGEDGTLYVLVGDSPKATRLVALDGQFRRLWAADLGPNVVSRSSVTLDCTRDPQGRPVTGAPGVAYLGTDDGRLIAVVVDSRGLDVDAPWPKLHRDPRNTANAATSMEPYRCP